MTDSERIIHVTYASEEIEQFKDVTEIELCSQALILSHKDSIEFVPFHNIKSVVMHNIEKNEIL